MTRTYPRSEARYDYDILQLMVADGFATYFPSADVYVLKTDHGSVAVRPHQVIHPAEKAEIFRNVPPSLEPVREVLAEKVAARSEAENLVEEYLTALHGIAENRDGEFDDEARDLVDRLLDGEAGLRERLRSQISTSKAPSRRRGWVSKDEEDELLGYFGL
jgi:hypothetical protein